MKKVTITAMIFFAVLSGNAANLQADIIIIDFGDIWHEAQPYIEDGFSISESSGASVSINNWATPTMSARPSFGFDNGYLTLTQVGGGIFDLLSLDLTEGPEGQEGTDFEVTALFSNDSTQKVTLIPDGTPGLETFYFTEFSSLKSVSFGTNLPDGQHRIDNIAVIPEPATALLLALGGLSLLRGKKQ